MLLQLALYEQPVGHRVVHAVHRLVGNLTWGPLGGLSGAGVGGLGRWLRSFEPTEGAEALDVPTENGILAAVPKKRTSHQKKRQRQLAGNNHQKPLHNIGRCPACGHYKRAHTLCMHCVQEIQRVWRMRDRAEATKLAEATKSSPSPLSPEDAAFNYPERLSKPSEYNRKLSDRSSYILKHPRTLPVPPKK